MKYLINLLTAIFVISFIGCDSQENNDTEKEVTEIDVTIEHDEKSVIEQNVKKEKKGDFIYEQKEIKTKDADKLKSEIKFICGRINIDGETGMLMKSDFKYKQDLWEPEVKYEESESIGFLKIFSEDGREEKNYNDEDDDIVWDISLNKDIEQQLIIEMAAGIGKFNFENFNLSELEFSMAAGATDMNLRNTSISKLKFNAAAGEVKINLSGEYKNNLQADINGGIGAMEITVPEKAGVKIKINGLFGKVNISDFKKKDKVYTNKTYNSAEYKLDIEITCGIGEITVKTEN